MKTPTKARIIRYLTSLRRVAIAAVLAATLPAASQSTAAEIGATLDHAVISARVAGRAVRIDPPPSDKAGNPAHAAPFQVVVPTDRDATWGARLAKSPKNALVRVIFTMPNGAFVENIGFFQPPCPFREPKRDWSVLSPS
ncbi:MAG: hypothetical protein ABNH26_03105 [Celeribacter sp.]